MPTGDGDDVVSDHMVRKMIAERARPVNWSMRAIHFVRSRSPLCTIRTNGFREPPKTRRIPMHLFRPYRAAKAARVSPRLDAVARSQIAEQRRSSKWRVPAARGSALDGTHLHRTAARVGQVLQIFRNDAKSILASSSIETSGSELWEDRLASGRITNYGDNDRLAS